MPELYYPYICIYTDILLKRELLFQKWKEGKLKSKSEKWRSVETFTKFQLLLPQWEKSAYPCGKINRLMQYREITAVNYAVHTQHTNSTVANAKLFNIQFVETCSNHWAISFYFTVLRRTRFLEFPDLLFKDTLSVDGYRVSFFGVKRPGRGADNTPPFSFGI